MKRGFLFLLLLSFTFSCRAQKNKFFHSIDVGIHSLFFKKVEEPQGWKNVFSKPLPYSLDTFSMLIPVSKGGLPEPALLFATLRLSKILFKQRLEWRTQLGVSIYAGTDAWLISNRYWDRSSPPPYEYKELRFSYNRRFLDYSQHLLFRLPAANGFKRLRFYAGPGLGAHVLSQGNIMEVMTTLEATPSGGAGTYITEKRQETTQRKAKHFMAPYYGASFSLEQQWGSSLSGLLEGGYQGYFTDQTTRQLSANAFDLSFILRYSF